MKTTKNLKITLTNCNDFSTLTECGDIIIEEDVVCTFPALQTSGYIYLRMNAKGTFPALQTSGYIYLRMNAKGTFPALQTSGYIYLSKNAKGTFPALQTSGYIYLRMNAKGTFPALQTSGSIDLNENARFETKYTKHLNYKSVDNSMFVIESEKTTKGIKILSGYNLLSIDKKAIKKEFCFVAEKEGYTAHGKSVRLAISDLQFKIIAEKLKHDPINKDTIITAEYYHIVTGSCKLGIESWINQNGIEVTEIKASELLPILEKSNAYGLERFKKLITF